MASCKCAIMALMLFAITMASLSGAFGQGELGLAPAPSPDAGAGYSVPVSAAVVASSVLLSLLALMKS
ncbi:UNVERIFIED_CONTAM: hypothetical protein Sangu_0053700 [Sesamum angustifolium]|uniref:Uncharacterized protein n=1 Tax=Sesamum angustifolium TaxID=2727405 RepID=A0AAW2RIH1_9LAMI